MTHMCSLGKRPFRMRLGKWCIVASSTMLFQDVPSSASGGIANAVLESCSSPWYRDSAVYATGLSWILGNGFVSWTSPPAAIATDNLLAHSKALQ
jgi:hypothetical protein